MTERVAWVLNFDAELELIDPGYRRSARMRETIRGLVREVVPRIRAVTGIEPVVVEGPATEVDGVVRGEAWCPTPRALGLLRDVGVAVPDAPPVEVLRRVNHRAFAAELGPLLPGARFVTTVEAAFDVMAAASDRSWLLKRPLGFSGRMRKIVRRDRLDAAARTWIAASMSAYGCGLMVEPLVERVLDLSIHGSVGAGGELRRGVPVVVDCGADGAFVGARVARAGELARDEVGRLVDAFERAAAALREAGYSGPFCIDAFRWVDDAGAVRLHPLGELNARYTMAWWDGVAARATPEG